ncbi:MAG: corrinoid protein [Candidatus Methanofastidiosia archaeon]
MILSKIAEALIEGDAPRVKVLTEEALKEGVLPIDVVNRGLIKGMDVVGERFKKMEISVPEVLISARAMYAGLEILKPLLSKSEIKSRGLFAIGTVKGDIHDIGKNLVSMMLEGAGFEVIDLGIDVPTERFIEIVRRKNPDILGMSALLNVTKENMREVIETLVRENLRDRIKIMIGGAAVPEDFAKEIGADAYAEDARDAVLKAKALLGIE